MIEKLRRIIDTVAERYFVDPSEDRGLPHVNLALMAIGYVSGRNVLLTGEPGFGKTSAAKVLFSALSGLPYDLYEACQIEGHPEQTRETLVGRPDFHKLATEGEVTIWNLSVYLPALLVDEINRLPEGKQDVLLTCVDTGRFNSPLGHTVFTGKRPFFATANYRDDGDLQLTAAMLDRFDVGIELGAPGPFHREQIARATAARAAIRASTEVDALLARLQDRDADEAQRFAAVAECRESWRGAGREAGLEPLDADDFRAWQRALAAVTLSQDALLLLDCLEAEMNFTPRYGTKRRSDPLDTSTHAQALAGSHVFNALSPRAAIAIDYFSRALALLGGRRTADKRDLAVITPRVLAHRLRPSEDFRAHFAEQQRKTRGTENAELSLRLLEQVETNFGSVFQSLSLLDNYRRGALGEADRGRAEALIADDPERIDHPLLRQYVTALRKRSH